MRSKFMAIKFCDKLLQHGIIVAARASTGASFEVDNMFYRFVADLSCVPSLESLVLHRKKRKSKAKGKRKVLKAALSSYLCRKKGAVWGMAPVC